MAKDQQALPANERQVDAFRRRRTAAQKYQPKRVRLLLVSEAPPDDLERYFYFDGASSRDTLFDWVVYVLFEAEPEGEKTPHLKALKRRGVFVIELKPDAPIDGAKHEEAAKWLPMRIEQLAPEAIVCIGREVGSAAKPELETAGLPLVPIVVPFGDATPRADFARELRHALVKAGLEKLIKPLPAS